jgi:ribosome-binding protein aMBF1 (putative translation factor)
MWLAFNYTPLYIAINTGPMSQAIQTARMEKQFTQKDLAQKVNEKPSVIQDYESSKAIPNPQILGKLERTLGVKLRGMWDCARPRG